MLRGLRSGFFRVADLPAARDWYAQLLGFGPYFDEAFYVGFDVAGYELGLLPGGGAGIGGSSASWAVDDPSAFITVAVGLGATVRGEPTDVGDGIVTASVLDPFGNELGVIFNPHFAPQLIHASAEDISERAITIARTVEVTPARAWELWSSSKGLAEWWTGATRVDLRPGGWYEIYFESDAKPGHRGADSCRVLSFLPNRMLSFTWNAPPDLRTRPLQTFVVLMFDPADGGTTVTLSHLGWPRSGLGDNETDWEATFSYFSEAWTSVMNRYGEYLGP